MVPKCVTVVTFGGSEVKNAGREAGPILLPSVAPEGTPPAMLLKKLAFGTNMKRLKNVKLSYKSGFSHQELSNSSQDTNIKQLKNVKPSSESASSPQDLPKSSEDINKQDASKM